MPYNQTASFGSALYNILASEQSLVVKTQQGEPAKAHQVDGRLAMQQGDLFTVKSEDGTTDIPVGIVADFYDFEDGVVRPISVITAGHVLRDRVSAEVIAAEDALKAKGLYLREEGM